VSRWFRHYAGMMRDDKLVRVAIRSGQTIERVAWIWGAILESAAEIDDGGRYDLDGPEIAYFLRADVADVERVLSELQSAGRCAEGRVVKWGDRQFTSDRSADRQRAFRERKRQSQLQGEAATDGVRDGNVTSPSRHGDAPETETETEKTEPKGSSKKRRPVPDDWQPSEFTIGSESRKVVDSWPPGELPAQIEQFKAHHRSKRNTFLDPQDAWSTWVLNTRKWGIGRNERTGSAGATGFAIVAEQLRRRGAGG
jgi:hypothetical protein